MFTQKTLYVLVACSLEESRQKVLEEVIDNIKSQKCVNELLHDLVVFDNASTCSGTLESINCFENVYVSNKNIGYWSAIHWCLNNIDLEQYEYLHMIESDMLFDDYSLLVDCELFMNEHPELCCMRTTKFDVKNRHLYDKYIKSPKSFTNVWQTIKDCNGKIAYFNHIRDKFYVTNMPASVCGLVRIKQFASVIDDLSKRNHFVEHDYQKLMFELSNEVALCDGGLHEPSTKTKVGSSWPTTSARFGYRESRADKIENASLYSVVKL